MNETVIRDRDNKRLIINRQVRGSSRLVWACWTEPRHLREWWGPDGWRSDIFELDLRPAGVWRYRLRPDRDHELDEEHWGRAVYEEIRPYESLTFLDGTSTPDGAPVPGTEMPTAVSITESGHGGCDVSITVGFPSAHDLEQAEAIGMVTGFTETLRRLHQYIGTTSEGTQE